MIKKRLSALALATLLALSSQAYAQQSSRSERVAREEKEARRLYDEGLAALSAGDADKAYSKFQTSFNLRESYDTAGNLGMLEMKKGLLSQAARHFEYCLRTFPTGENRELKTNVEKMYAEVLHQVVTIHAKLGPSGVKVRFGEHSFGRAPLKHPLFAKADMSYQLTIEDDEGRSRNLEVSGEAGETVEVELHLDDKPLQTKGPASGLEGDEEPIGKSWIDENQPPGESGAPQRNWVPAYFLGGGTVVAVGTSFIFRSLSASSTDEMDELADGLSRDACTPTNSPSTCAEISDVGDRANTQATIADASLIVGGVLGAATIGYVVYTLTKPGSSTNTQATVITRPGGALFSLSGQF